MEEIKKGIEAYQHERKVLLRLLRIKKRLTSDEFDRVFSNRECRKRSDYFSYDRSSFILGDMFSGMWGQWLELLQYMCELGLARTEIEGGNVVYCSK
uniref:Uncharacterized protein n=1 Tax=viral metagenome TaxID=1070528 RepID=A0A6M3JUN5_9ZZZZ